MHILNLCEQINTHRREKLSDNQKYRGSCFCGGVELEVSGKCIAMGYCHCDSCRHWSAAPVTAYSLWTPDAVKITKGEDKIMTYNKTPKSYRKSCSACGGHIFTDHKQIGLLDVYPAVLTELEFEPSMHVFYEDSVLVIKDGLPKFKDLPEEAGGSGKLLTE